MARIQDKADLLLHCCCAHCTETMLHLMKIPRLTMKETKTTSQATFGLTFKVTLFFDNSNIHPRTEYLARLNALKVVSDRYGLDLIIADWSPREWFTHTLGWKEKGRIERCKPCWKLRLFKTAHKARERGIRYMSTTMLTSQYLNNDFITQIGNEVSSPDLHFVDFKNETENLHASAVDKSNTTQSNAPKSKGYYMQNYCGCMYSLIERYEEKFETR